MRNIKKRPFVPVSGIVRQEILSISDYPSRNSVGKDSPKESSESKEKVCHPFVLISTVIAVLFSVPIKMDTKNRRIVCPPRTVYDMRNSDRAVPALLTLRYNHGMSAESLDLRSPLQFLKGVGTQRAEILQRIGIHKASDLLFYFPRDYQDMTERREIDQLEEGNKVQTVVGYNGATNGRVRYFPALRRLQSLHNI